MIKKMVCLLLHRDRVNFYRDYAHVWECRRCKTILGTDNQLSPISEFFRAWIEAVVYGVAFLLTSIFAIVVTSQILIIVALILGYLYMLFK